MRIMATPARPVPVARAKMVCLLLVAPVLFKVVPEVEAKFLATVVSECSSCSRRVCHTELTFVRPYARLELPDELCSGLIAGTRNK